MSTTGDNASGPLWYARRHGQVRGPFSTEALWRALLVGELRVSDEVSEDGKLWMPVINRPDLIPELTPELLTAEDRQRLQGILRHVDRRVAERRRSQGEPPAPERRREDRRRPELAGVHELRVERRGARRRRRWLAVLVTAAVVVLLLVYGVCAGGIAAGR